MRVFNSKAIIGRGYVSAFFYGFFALLIGFSAASQGLSHYFADDAFRTGSDSDAAAAIYYQAENPDAHKIRGMIFLRNKDYAAAANSFEQAAALRENDFLLWLRLGFTRLKLEDVNGAQAAYQKAVMLAPTYSQPNFHMGKMLLKTGQPEQAFLFLAKAAEHDNELYPEILDLAKTTYPDDPSAIEKAVQTESDKGRKIVARYLIKRFWMTDSVRSFLLSDKLSDEEKDGFISDLIYRGNFSVARDVWLAKLKTESTDSEHPLFDGGFEKISASDPSGFGWQIDQKVSAIAVAIDQKEFHSGSRAVLIKFAGNVELNRKLISQLVYLKPNTKYQLKFFLHSTELISAGLPRVIISDGVSGEILGSSEALGASDQWVEAKVAFTTKHAPVASISLQRPNCSTSPCPIFGEISLDDFSLTEN